MTLEVAIAPTRLVAMCLGPESGGAVDIGEVPRRSPGPDEIRIAVEAASVNPIDVRRASGYGRTLLSLMGGSRFPMTLGNDFAGVVATVGSRHASGFTPSNAHLPCARRRSCRRGR
jgi:reticulon-4-interacting protein 1, mitochondrial